MDTILYKAMGQKMRQSRLMLKMTQEQVAECVGVEPAYYGQLERATKVPSLQTLIRIAECLKVEPSSLLDLKGEESDFSYQSIKGLIKNLGKKDKSYLVGMVRDAVQHLKKSKL